MGQWVQSQDWHQIYKTDNVNMKAELFEKLIMEKVNFLFPEKTMKINENDKPWFNSQLTNLDRQCKREYNKHKKSEKWKKLHMSFLEKSQKQKVAYYENMVEDLNLKICYTKCML